MSEREVGGLPEEEFAALMAQVDRAAPLMRALRGAKGAAEGGEGEARRALLCALKPYLSPSRCEAAEYLLRIWHLGELLKGLVKEG